MPSARAYVASMGYGSYAAVAAPAARCSLALLLCLGALALSGCMVSANRKQRNDDIYQRDILSHAAKATGGPTRILVAHEAATVDESGLLIDLRRTASAGPGPFVLLAMSEIPREGLPLGVSETFVVADDWRTCIRQSDGQRLRLRFVGLVEGAMAKRVGRRFHYLWTVPVDLVTSPVQMVIFLVVVGFGPRC